MATYFGAAGRQYSSQAAADASRSSNNNSSNSSKKSNSSSNDFNTKYASNIAGLAKANNVDTGTASAMLQSNLAGTSQYQGGGVLDYGQASRDLSASKSAALNSRPSYSSGSSANDYYSSYLSDQQSALRKAQKAAEEAARQRTQAAVDANNAYIPQVNAQTDKQLQEAYISSQQAKSNAPQALAAMGYTGGATESSLLGIDANYGNQRNTLETSRNTSLDQIRQNANQIQASGDATLSDLAAQYYNQMATAQQQAASQAQEQSNWQQQFDAQQAANTKSDYANTAAAYYNDYQAQINKLKAQGYTDDDYEIKVLNQLRNQKKSDLAAAQATADQQAFDNYIKQQQLANSTAQTNYNINEPYFKPSSKSSSTKKYTTSQIQSMYENGWIDEATARSMLGI